MAFTVFDSRRGTWSIRWNKGGRWASQTVTRRPPPGWKPGDPKPKEPAVVVEAKALRMKQEKALKAGTLSECSASTVRGFLDERRELCKTQGSANSDEAFRLAFNHFADWCERNSISAVEQVTSEACGKWFKERSQEISPKTKMPRSYNGMLRDKALLSAAWNRAVRFGSIPKNPWIPVEVPARPSVQKRGSWTPEQLELLLSHSKPWLRNMVVVGCHTGIRIAALLKLEWRDIEFSEAEGAKRGLVTVRKELDKAGKGYAVPMSRLCLETITAMHARKSRGLDFVITGMLGRPIGWSKNTGEAIQRACERAGLAKPESPNHHMRRTFGRQAVLGQLTGRPIPIYVVSRWLGHSSVKMTEHYLDLKIDASQQWMEEI